MSSTRETHLTDTTAARPGHSPPQRSDPHSPSGIAPLLAVLLAVTLIVAMVVGGILIARADGAPDNGTLSAEITQREVAIANSPASEIDSGIPLPSHEHPREVGIDTTSAATTIDK